MPESDRIVFAAIIPAAGSGRRMGSGIPKQFLELGGKPIIARTVGTFLGSPSIHHVLVVIPAEHRAEASRILQNHLTPPDFSRVQMVNGGETRQDSVQAGLSALPRDTQYVLIHDGARPLVSEEIIWQCIEEVQMHGAVVVATPVHDTVKKVDSKGKVDHTVDRKGLWLAQTPQAAAVELLEAAFSRARQDSFTGTDEASLLEHAGIPVRVVMGSEENIKITRPGDLQLAENIAGEERMLRIGHGFDAHRFKIGRHLILGGVDIPFDLGLEGHSDADVLIHAFIDALLGAAGEGDIGGHFPDKDPQYRDISSLKLLEEVMRLLQEQKFSISNADLTIICQRPRLAPFVDEMRTNLARACFVEKDAINIKATTTEMMGYTGRGEGIAVHAVTLLSRQNKQDT